MHPAGKTIIVTGAGSGMGREMALLLLQKNARVVGIDIRIETLTETSQLAGVATDRFVPVQLDITNREAVAALPQQLAASVGPIDGLINNAGIIQKFVKINELPFAEIERVMNVNFYGMVNLTKAFLPQLLTRPEAHIVNISSMGGFLPVPGAVGLWSGQGCCKIIY